MSCCSNDEQCCQLFLKVGLTCLNGHLLDYLPVYHQSNIYWPCKLHFNRLWSTLCQGQSGHCPHCSGKVWSNCRPCSSSCTVEARHIADFAWGDGEVWYYGWLYIIQVGWHSNGKIWLGLELGSSVKSDKCCQKLIQFQIVWFLHLVWRDGGSNINHFRPG